MKHKKKDKDGEARARARGSRKNFVASDSLQAAAGTGFIGFSAFQTASKSSPVDTTGGDTPGSTVLPRGGVNTSYASSKEAGGIRGRGKPDGGLLSAAQGQVLPPHYSGGDSNLTVVGKRLSKRDNTTKIKAMAELRAMCRLVTPDQDDSANKPGNEDRDQKGGMTSSGAVTTSAEALGGMAPHWVFLYQRLAIEGDRRTREAANTTLLYMLKANRKAFHPLMPSLMGPWWCSQADTAPEVSSSAKEAFETVFPQSRRAAVLQRCAGGVLKHIGVVLQQTPAMLEQASGCTPEEAAERSERLTVSALTAMSSFMEAVGSEVNENFCRSSHPDDGANTAGQQDPRNNDQEATTYWSVVDESLWARLDDPRPAVRRAMYMLVSSCCRHAAALLRPPPATLGEDHELGPGKERAGEGGIDQEKWRGGGSKRSRVAVAPLIVGLLSENEDSNHREAWQVVLLVLREFKETWMGDKGGEMVLPTLLTRLRKGAFLPTSSSSYPCLLPLLASLPVEALVEPADRKKSTGNGKSGPPFCAAFLETLWCVIARGTGSNTSGGVTSSCDDGWLHDVTSAHLECVTFLLLKKLEWSWEGGSAAVFGGHTNDEGTETFEGEASSKTIDDPVGTSLSAVTDNLRRSWRSFVASDCDSSPGVDEDTSSSVSNLLERVESSGKKEGVREAFASALGHLHSGEGRGAGAMGSKSWSEKVWETLLQGAKDAVDRRYERGVLWMGQVLVRALTRIKARPVGGRRVSNAKGGEKASPSLMNKEVSRREGGGGLPGVCRDLFQHCVKAIGFVEPPEDGESYRLAVVSPRDTPLLSLMASIARVLGIDESSALRGDEALSPADSPVEDFYRNFLVPRFVASASGERDASGDAVSSSTVTRALKELVEVYLRAESGASGQGGVDFRFLLQRALGAQPGLPRLRATTAVLQMAPACLLRRREVDIFPEVEEAALKACGLSSTATGDETENEKIETRRSDPERLMSTDISPSLDMVPAFLQACLGVRDGRSIAPPFIGPAASSRIVDASLSVFALGHDALPLPPDSPPSVVVTSASDYTSSSVPHRSTAMATLEGLLGVLGAEKAATGGNRSEEKKLEGGEDAMACVRKRSLSLLLAAFSGCGDSRAERRLWGNHGATALAKLVATGSSFSSSYDSSWPGANAPVLSATPTRQGDGFWEEFLTGAIEHTRRMMEGGRDLENDGTGNPGKAAALALALVELERAAVTRGPPLHRPERKIGSSPAANAVVSEEMGVIKDKNPVLWRLGLTDPSVWRERRSEALSAQGSSETVSTVDLARRCVGSRWAARWQTVAAVLGNSPDPSARLEVLTCGVPAAVDGEDAEGGARGSHLQMAGEALQEMLTAGVLVSRAVLEVRGCSGGLLLSSSVDEGESRDLPPRLFIPSASKEGEGGAGKSGKSGARGDHGDPLDDFGVGLPVFRGLGSWGEVGAEEVATVAAAGVMDVASVCLGVRGNDTSLASLATGEGAWERRAAGGKGLSAGARHATFLENFTSDAAWHPFGFLLPRDLWRTAAFEPSCPPAGERSLPRPPEGDFPQHDVLLYALAGAVSSLAKDAAAIGEGESDAGALWVMSCLAEVSTGLMVSVVGEAFSRGLSLGNDANRVMAIRAGTHKLPSALPSSEDLEPGARTLYTREGQAVTVVAAHVDPGGGDAYYTVRPLNAPGSERQTVLERLSLVPPEDTQSAHSLEETNAASKSPACPWLVRPRVSAKLGEILDGPLAAIERLLWEESGRFFGGSGLEGHAGVLAAAAALRGCASTCLRASLLCAPAVGTEVGNDPARWEAIIPRAKALRRRWASAAVRSRSAVEAARRSSGTGDADDAGEGRPRAVVMALSAVVLSAFFSATPLMPPSGQEEKEGDTGRFPARLRQALLERATPRDETRPDATTAAAAWGGGAQVLAGLGWIRDSVEASCKVHLSPSPVGVGGALFSELQSHFEAIVSALVRSDPWQSGSGPEDGVAGVCIDLALARACSGLFAAEAVRTGRGHGAALSTDTKASVVSWAVSKFLLSGGLVSSSSVSAGDSGGNKRDHLALCLETARLLTAVAWDGRRGWGVEGSGSIPSRRLVSGAGERMEVWRAARAPAVWRGLHAAVVGAVESPTIQLCAFEVLEAAASGWDYRAAPSAAHEDLSGSDVNEGLDGDGGDVVDGGEDGGGKSIVSRLAAALGGWGKAPAAAATRGTVGDEEILETEVVVGGEGAEDQPDAVAEAQEEEAKEQQDDLELVARCFPEDMLLAVEALPTTMESLAEEEGGAYNAPWEEERKGPRSSRSSQRVSQGTSPVEVEDTYDRDELGELDDDEEEQEDDEAILEEGEEEQEEGEEEQEEGVEEQEEGVEEQEDREEDLEEDERELEEDEEETVENHAEEENQAGEEHLTRGTFDAPETMIAEGDQSPEVEGVGVGDVGDADPESFAVVKDPDPPSGLKSRRKRLRRKRHGNHSSPTVSRGTRGISGGRLNDRSLPSGPALTAPFLTWLLWLEHCKRASALDPNARSAARAFVVRAGALEPVLGACFRVLKASQGDGSRASAATSKLGPAQGVRVSRLDPRKPKDLARLALAVYFRTVQVFPALSRSWWSDDCPRGLRVWAAEFTRKHVSPALIKIEAQIIADATERGVWDECGDMTVRASANSRQVVASYVKEECTLEASIQLPPEYPLRNVEVTCTKRMGISESRWRKWVLQIVTLLSLQDGSVLDAVMLWKKNVDKEFEGVEPCVICYGILHPRDMALPQLSCKTCNNRFHSTCLFKWFETSHKSRCPICQQPWA